MDNSTELITYSSYCSDGINLTCDYNTSTHEINCIRDILEANAYCGLNVTVNTSDMCSDIQNALSVSQAMVNDSYLYCWGWDPFTCVVGYDGEIGTRSIKNWVNVTGCLKSCDLNGDGIIINGWNDLMPAYKCFLGIQTNCDLNHQNWGLMKQEYQCFSAS
jgi:hypothetical protein